MKKPTDRVRAKQARDAALDALLAQAKELGEADTVEALRVRAEALRSAAEALNAAQGVLYPGRSFVPKYDQRVARSFA